MIHVERRQRRSFSLAILLLYWTATTTSSSLNHVERTELNDDTSRSSFLEKLWKSLSQQINQNKKRSQQPEPKGIDRSSTSSGRRRALYEHSLRKHYGTQLADAVDEDNVPQNTVDAVEEILRTYLHEDSVTDYYKQHADRTTSLHMSLPPFPQSLRESNLKLLREMFQHAYDSYMYYGWPSGEVRPLTCKPATFDLIRLPGLTLIDALDTLVVLGNYTEFARSVERLRALHQMQPLFHVDQNVSLFETNIRVLGGLLSAHQMAVAYVDGAVLKEDIFTRSGDIQLGRTEEMECMALDLVTTLDCDCETRGLQDCATKKAVAKNTTRTANDYWKYDGFLLELALDLGERLYPAFNTNTGIPYGTVNLLYGVPEGETTVASLAGGGTLTLEFELLSRLTGDDRFGKAAKLATRSLWVRRTALNLFGKHIDIQSGAWTESLSGIGSNSDSFYEYLAKQYMLFPEDSDFWIMLVAAYTGIYNDSRKGEWYVDVDMNHGTGGNVFSKRVLESLMAFYPGMQILLGEVAPAARTLNSFFMVRELLGFLPERFNFANWKVDVGMSGAGKHPLRPELLESCYFLHRATKGMNAGRNSTTGDSSGWLWAADFALQKLSETTRTSCGFAGVKILKPETSGSVDGSADGVKFMNEMPSFFLSETLKYLYLTFDEDNILHQDDGREWIFTTEAHPLHHVPEASQIVRRKKSPFKRQVGTLKSLLSDRLHKKKPDLKSPVHLDKEKWAPNADPRTYHDGLNGVGLDASVRRGKLREEIGEEATKAVFGDRKLIEPFISLDHPADSFDGMLIEDNIVYLTLKRSGIGEGTYLRKACPNFYSSDLLWMHALNGGSIDYADVYSSSVDDGLGYHSHFLSPMNAGEALGFLGSGVYLGRSHDDGTSCPISQRKDDEASRSQTTEANGKEATSAGEVAALKTKFGSFHVSSFPQGGGFYIRHVESGETITATFLSDEKDHSRSEFVLTHVTVPGLAEKSAEKDVLGEEVETAKADSPSMTEYSDHPEEAISGNKGVDHSIVISDFESNSFSCEIVLIKKHIAEDDADNHEETLATYPCAPALFGPTHMPQLVESGDIIVEAPVLPPFPGDLYGCEEETVDIPPIPDEGLDPSAVDGMDPSLQADSGTNKTAAESCQNMSVSVVNRGTCTFLSKAINQKKRWNAGAVVIVNSEDNELFVMSGEEGESASGRDDIPVTVLVTGGHGEDLLSTAAGDGDSESYVFARISLLRQERAMANSEGKIVAKDSNSEILRWPIVFGNSGMLQIFSRRGWGIHAVHQDGQWQINLLQHKVDETMK